MWQKLERLQSTATAIHFIQTHNKKKTCGNPFDSIVGCGRHTYASMGEQEKDMMAAGWIHISEDTQNSDVVREKCFICSIPIIIITSGLKWKINNVHFRFRFRISCWLSVVHGHNASTQSVIIIVHYYGQHKWSEIVLVWHTNANTALSIDSSDREQVEIMEYRQFCCEARSPSIRTFQIKCQGGKESAPIPARLEFFAFKGFFRNCETG